MNSRNTVKYRMLCMAFICVGLGLMVPAAHSAADKGFESNASAMTQAQLESAIRAMADSAEGGGGVLQFEYDGVILVCVSDIANDRMRIVAPIGDYSGITPQQKDLMLAANFHTALDARYAMSKGVLYAVFIHPLSTLAPVEISSAVRQVATLMQTFGREYSSGELNFPGPGPQRPQPTDKTPL